MSGNVIVRFEEVDFDFGHTKPILTGASFSVRRGSKIALMGQNGAGKSTIFKLLTGVLEPTEGRITVDQKLTVALSKQVLVPEELELTVRQYFQHAFKDVVYDIDPKIDEVLVIVHLEAGKERLMKTFSGGQKARLLLARALIQKPDLLLLDEPTNNLDVHGIEHLEDFLKNYSKTVMVISHDARFLNSFTDGVLYLDIFKRFVEQYTGNYTDVVREISARIAKERRENVRLEKGIQERKDKASFFANKGGQMRARAKKMRVEAEGMDEAKVEVRREDKTLPPFTIPFQEDLTGMIALFHTIPVIKKGERKEKKKRIELRQGDKLLVKGPNGIGKTTFLESFVREPDYFADVHERVKIGYYAQDFSGLDYEATVFDVLKRASAEDIEEKIRATAARFLIGGDLVYKPVHTLSEGQKGLVSFARLVLESPGLLILDEPTNHINFRHVPIIAKAVRNFEGAVIIVSHDESFLKDIGETLVVDMGAL
ncbi:MAG: ABC-F family ATP-binding cassette domain-containing protein [Candidatus Paceibacterota bacterium]